jgi:hypothetical protein
MVFDEATFASLVKDIVQFIDGFTLTKVENRFASLSHSDGRTIILYADFHKKRLSVNGSYGVDADGRNVYPDYYGIPAPDRITVSAEKTAQKIASDICRRFLPKYTDAYSKCREKVEEYKQARNDAEAGLKQIADVLNLMPDIRGEAEKKIYISSSHQAWGDISTYDGESFAFKLFRIPRDKALKITEILRDS